MQSSPVWNPISSLRTVSLKFIWICWAPFFSPAFTSLRFCSCQGFTRFHNGAILAEKGTVPGRLESLQIPVCFSPVQYPLEFIWVWWGVIALVGFYLLFVFATAWALQRVRFKPKRGRPPTDRKEAAQLGSTSPEQPLSVKYLANQANEPHPLEKIDVRDSVMSIDNENKTMIKAPGILEYVPVTLSFHAIHYDVSASSVRLNREASMCVACRFSMRRP
jgi:hypothetical protein